MAGIDLGFRYRRLNPSFETIHRTQGAIIMKPPILAFAAAAAALLAAGTASAERPADLAGTTWTVQTNRNAVQLVIETQSGPGANGAANCRSIRGHFNISPPEIDIRGWYCPQTGHIAFKHNNLHSGVTVRVFSGHVSDDVIGQPLYMAGTMTVFDAAFGDLGQYNFSATR